MLTQDQLHEVLQRMVNLYRTVYGADIMHIVLYGSYARHDNDDESDLDLAAIVRGDRKNLQKKLYALWDMTDEINLEYGIIISPTVIPYDEFITYQQILPYYRAIKEEGVEIGA